MSSIFALNSGIFEIQNFARENFKNICDILQKLVLV